MRKMAGITKAQCKAFGQGINWVQEHIIRFLGKVFYIYILYPWCSIAHKGDLPLRSMHANQNLANLKKLKLARNMDIKHSAGPKYMKEE